MENENRDKSFSTEQYLTFKLGVEIFAIEITKVREVIDFAGVTKVPGTPEYMRGVLNLRGSVVPVIDLQMKFGMGTTKKTVNTCVIIVEVPMEDGVTQLGALADSVQEVVDLEQSQIEPPPRIGMNLRTEFIKGMGKSGDQFIIILDIDKIFSEEELNIVEDIQGNSITAQLAQNQESEESVVE